MLCLAQAHTMGPVLVETRGPSPHEVSRGFAQVLCPSHGELTDTWPLKADLSTDRPLALGRLCWLWPRTAVHSHLCPAYPAAHPRRRSPPVPLGRSPWLRPREPCPRPSRLRTLTLAQSFPDSRMMDGGGLGPLASAISLQFSFPFNFTSVGKFEIQGTVGTVLEVTLGRPVGWRGQISSSGLKAALCVRGLRE